MKVGISCSDLFAISQGSINDGVDSLQCHWCGSRCTRTWTHDDVPPIPFQRSKSTARNPQGQFVCTGCWLWRRGSVTVNFLTGGYKDRQQAKNHSWWINEEGAWALRKEDYQHLWNLVISPPLRYSLALLDGEGVSNHLQLMIANDCPEILGDTQLWFTVNGIPHFYSISELEAGLKIGETGREPGVRALIRLLGKTPPNLTFKPQKKPEGRPSTKDPIDRPNKLVVPKSGMLVS